MYDALIVVNGEIPHPSYWQSLAYRTLICTDGAANFLSQFTITPDIIIGDMDSIPVGTQLATPKLLQKRYPNSEIHLIEDQNSTDFEKSLRYAEQNALKQLLCVGAFGKAADHSLYNLSLIARYQTKLNVMLLNVFDEGSQWIFPLQEHTCISTKVGAIVSFFPFPQATLTSTGLRWDLQALKLTQLNNSAVRNKAVNNEIDVHTEGSCLCFVISDTPPILVFT